MVISIRKYLEKFLANTVVMSNLFEQDATCLFYDGFIKVLKYALLDLEITDKIYKIKVCHFVYSVAHRKLDKNLVDEKKRSDTSICPTTCIHSQTDKAQNICSTS